MSTTLSAPPVTPRRGRLWVKILLVVLCALMAAMWIYYFFFASDRGIYQLDDTQWRVSAKQICVDATRQREALADTTAGFITDPTPEQMRERADLADKATDILDTMLTDLVAIPVKSDRDRSLLAVFEENYRIILKDRRGYAERLREGDNSGYTETLVAGGPVTNVVLDFTAGVKGNDVPECSPPNDLSSDVRP